MADTTAPRPSETITYVDVRAQVSAAVTAGGVELAEGIDIDAVTREIIDTYGLISIDGWHPITGAPLIEFDDFWAIVARHDATQR